MRLVDGRVHPVVLCDLRLDPGEGRRPPHPRLPTRPLLGALSLGQEGPIDFYIDEAWAAASQCS
jgi:hypothetical protein